jgi:hypothetical protein
MGLSEALQRNVRWDDGAWQNADANLYAALPVATNVCYSNREGLNLNLARLRHFSTYEINFIVHKAAHQRKRQVIGLLNFEFVLS